MDGQVVGAMMSCRVHEDGKGGNANEVCFGDGVPERGRTGNAHEVPFGDEVPEGGKTRNANAVL